MNVSKKIRVDLESIKSVLKALNISLTDASILMGHSASYMSQCGSKGEMTLGKAKLFCSLFGCTLADITSKEPAAPPETADDAEYTVNIKVGEDKLHLEFCRGGKVMHRAYAHIKEPSELGIMQAFSYAAHLYYKFAQQNTFKED